MYAYERDWWRVAWSVYNIQIRITLDGQLLEIGVDWLGHLWGRVSC